MSEHGLRQQDYETIKALKQELADLRARLEKAEPIVAAALNLIEQKGRHNTEIAYKRLEDVLKTHNAKLAGGPQLHRGGAQCSSVEQ